MKDSYRLLCQQ